jgi:hypothetical protein
MTAMDAVIAAGKAKIWIKSKSADLECDLARGYAPSYMGTSHPRKSRAHCFTQEYLLLAILVLGNFGMDIATCISFACKLGEHSHHQACCMAKGTLTSAVRRS